jgi:hypothetical protein
MSGILALSESSPLSPYPSFSSLASPIILLSEELLLCLKLSTKNSNGDSKEFPRNLQSFSMISPDYLAIPPRGREGTQRGGY